MSAKPTNLKFALNVMGGYLHLSAFLWIPAVVLATCVIGLFISSVFGPSKLNGIPGPRLAAWTPLWLWFEDISRRSPGTVRRLHAKHGNIVRLGPNEISINDVEAYNNVLYRQNPRFLKAKTFYQVFAVPETTIFTTEDPIRHGEFRRLMSNAFSRKEILNFEPQIWQVVDTLSSIISENYTMGRPVELSHMFRSLSLDIISKFAYGDSFGALQMEGFENPLLDAFDSFQIVPFVFMLIPALQRGLVPLLAKLPFRLFQATASMEKKVEEGLAKLLRKKTNKSIDGFVPMLAMEIEIGKNNGFEVTHRHLVSDGIGSIFAGTDTTGLTLAVGVWSVFSDSEAYSRLYAELKGAWPELGIHPSLADLEKLPYLRGCVREALRIATPISGRLPRVCPPSGWSYAGHDIPPGTVVSSSSYLLHNNEDAFPNPEVFDPTRWLGAEQDVKLRESYLAPFSRGSRGCIGQSLALAEVYIAIANIIRRFTVEEVVDKELNFERMFASGLPTGQRLILRKRNQDNEGEGAPKTMQG